MKKQSRSLSEMINAQVLKWEKDMTDLQPFEKRPVITISRESGCQGGLLAQLLANRLGYGFYAGNIIDQVARDTKISSVILQTFDEQPKTFMDDMLASLGANSRLTSDEYIKHLAKIILAIGKVGRAVILGRGANFILDPATTFRIRVLAPLESRVRHVMDRAKISEAEARRQIQAKDLHRAEFVRSYFHADIADPAHYDLIVNTARVAVEACVEGIIGMLPKETFWSNSGK